VGQRTDCQSLQPLRQAAAAKSKEEALMKAALAEVRSWYDMDYPESFAMWLATGCLLGAAFGTVALLIDHIF
jgi:hypothetical protein